MKYVMFKDGAGGRHPVLFSDHLVHNLVADGVRHAYGMEGQDMAPISAGFYSEEKMRTSGKSESMGMASMAHDAAYIVMGSAVAYMPPEVAVRLMQEFNRRYRT